MALRRKHFFKKNRKSLRLAQIRRMVRLKNIKARKAKIAERHALYFVLEHNQ